jgi:DNA primase
MSEREQEAKPAAAEGSLAGGGYGAGRRLAPIDFAALKRTASIVELLESIGWQAARTRRGGNELRGGCPIHGSRSAQSMIFSVTPSRNIFKCFRCDAGGDTIALAAYLLGIPRDQRVKAAVALCHQLGIPIPRLRT